MLETRITEKFGLKYPLLSAPMSMHSGGRLAGAVSRAGGLGLFGGTHPAGEDWLRSQIGIARTACGARPFGIGFITHMIPDMPGMFDVALEERVPVIAFSFSDPGRWVRRAKEADATVICQVQSIESAAQAVAAGTDMLVAQGNEAGGHTGRSKLKPLLMQVLREFPGVPTLAAGGIGNGRSFAEVLSAGADGAWLGTALLATRESVDVSEAYKNMIVAASSDQTVYTEVFDLLDVAAFGIPPWPPGIAGRAIVNPLLEKWHGKEAELRAKLQDVLPAYRQGIEENDVATKAVWAGNSVDFVNEICSVDEVISRICREAEEQLKKSDTR